MERGDGGESVARGRVVTRSRRVDASLTGALGALPAPRVAWVPPSGPAVVGGGAAATVRAAGSDRFERVRTRASTLLAGVDATAEDPGPRLFGGFAFARGGGASPPWDGFPDAYFVLPRVQVAAVDGETHVRVTRVDADSAAVESALEDACATVTGTDGAVGPPPGVEHTERVPEAAEWHRQVRTVLDRIEGGSLRKAVLASALTATLAGEFELPGSVGRLARDYPDCHCFAVDPAEGGAFVGATPERLVTKRGDHVATEALAGSIRRGDSPAEDERLAERLAASAKDRHEHRLVVDAIREQLAPVAGDVTTGERSIRTLDTVQHLHTPVEATLSGDHHVVDIAARLHPTPAVGGIPPDEALRTITETESFDRGWYAGPVGWIGPGGDGTFAVGIRSAVGDGRTATLFAGNGIVADSDPAAEWEEVQLKFRPMLDHLR